MTDSTTIRVSLSAPYSETSNEERRRPAESSHVLHRLHRTRNISSNRVVEYQFQPGSTGTMDGHSRRHPRHRHVPSHTQDASTLTTLDRQGVQTRWTGTDSMGALRCAPRIGIQSRSRQLIFGRCWSSANRGAMASGILALPDPPRPRLRGCGDAPLGEGRTRPCTVGGRRLLVPLTGFTL